MMFLNITVNWIVCFLTISIERDVKQMIRIE